MLIAEDCLGALDAVHSGGMIILSLPTGVLGYERKTAVGAKTFDPVPLVSY